MNEDLNLKVIELRNYLMKTGARDRFIDYFERHFIDSQTKLGGYPLGQFTVEGEGDKFFWIRGFEDMASRIAFLRAFYERGEVWKKFGPDANRMMLDSDNVYLLRPAVNAKSAGEANQTVKRADFEKLNGRAVIDFYFSRDGRLDDLINFFQTEYAFFLDSPKIGGRSFWVSEMAENDFPRLPVIQDKNLLVMISSFENEAEYQTTSARIETAEELKNRLQKLVTGRKTLLLHAARKNLLSKQVA